MSYIICMDVSGDIAADIPETGEIGYIPMNYSLGDEMRTCERPEERELLHRFYDGQRNGDFTRTSQISPFLYEQYMEPWFKQGLSVLYLCLSSGLSSTFQSANIAKASLEEKYPGCRLIPIDTRSATAGLGILAEMGRKNQKNGMSLEENAAFLQEAAAHLHHWFLVSDLKYLQRGGRVSATTAMIGTALNIIPILTINPEGKLDTIAKKRGRKSACKYLVERFKETYAEGGIIYIIDADTPETGDYLEKAVRKLYPEATIRRTALSPIIGAHTGPDMAAICHFGK